jgi:nitrile hydratase beta subunit
MRNVHDLGGQLSYGAVDRGADDGYIFHNPYESLTFGLTLASMANGFLHNIDERRYAKERLPPEVLIRCTYWEWWLAVLEIKLAENGVLDTAAIRERERRAAPGATAPATPPDGLHDRIDGLITRGRGLATQLRTPRKFAVGQRVRTRVSNNRRHTRLPAYAMGREAVIVRQLPAFPLADVVAEDPHGPSEWTYQVRFEAEELWGEDGGGRDAVLLDVFESYLSAMPPSTDDRTPEEA